MSEVWNETVHKTPPGIRMSDFDSLREDIAAIGGAMTEYGAAVNRHADATDSEIKRLWRDNAELRDELHALANRLEALTNFVVSDPAEVAAKIGTDANQGTLREVRATDNTGPWPIRGDDA